MQTQISTLERYAVSSATTFITAFVISLGLQLQAGAVDPTNLGWGLLASIGAVALRAGAKAVVEYLYGITGEGTTTS